MYSICKLNLFAVSMSIYLKRGYKETKQKLSSIIGWWFMLLHINALKSFYHKTSYGISVFVTFDFFGDMNACQQAFLSLYFYGRNYSGR